MSNQENSQENSQENRAKTYIVYHRKDLDGKCSGAIAYNALLEKVGNDTELIPYGYDYPDTLPDFLDTLTEKDHLYLLDVSFPVEKMKELILQLGNRFIWIDHHWAKIKMVRDALGGVHINGLQGDAKNRYAGCYLTYVFFKHRAPEGAIKLLSDYDTWQNVEPDWSSIILPFQYGARTVLSNDVTDADWKAFVEASELGPKQTYGRGLIKHLTDKGLTILEYVRSSAAKLAKVNAFSTTILGMRAIAINTPGVSSDTFTAVYDQEKHDLMIGFYLMPTGHWSLSFRSDKPEVNVADLAYKFGGGGHPGAAGATVDTLPFKVGGYTISVE